MGGRKVEFEALMLLNSILRLLDNSAWASIMLFVQPGFNDLSYRCLSASEGFVHPSPILNFLL